MFKINRKIEYSLIALKHMQSKQQGQLTTAKEICEIYNTPFDPTSRVLQLMVQNEILQASQGAKGGYQVVKDLSTLSLKSLCDMIIGHIEIANCFHDDYSSCEIASFCKIIAPMLKLNESINNLFETIMVSTLLEARHTDEKIVRKKITSNQPK